MTPAALVRHVARNYNMIVLPFLRRLFQDMLALLPSLGADDASAMDERFFWHFGEMLLALADWGRPLWPVAEERQAQFESFHWADDFVEPTGESATSFSRSEAVAAAVPSGVASFRMPPRRCCSGWTIMQ